MKTVGSQQLRNECALLLDGVQHHKRAVVVTRHGRHSAVLVSRDDLVSLFGFVAELEARVGTYGGGRHPASDGIDEIRERITYGSWFGGKS